MSGSQSGVRRAGLRAGERGLDGYTLLELVVVLVIAAVLAAVLTPRFLGPSAAGVKPTADQFLAACRYAETLAQNQGVETTVTVGASTFSVTQGGTPVANPTLQSAAFVTHWPKGVTVSPQTSVSFSRSESSNSVTTPVTFTIAGVGPTRTVHVLATGYVYECRSGGACP